MTTPATPTYDLVLQVVTWLQAISVANGYRTNVGASATAEPSATRSESPQLAVVAVDLPIGRETSQRRQGEIELLIEVEIPVTRTDAQLLAHQAIADVLDALPSKQASATLPPYCTGVTVTGRRILQRPDGAALIVAQVTARAGLIEHHVSRT
jgi:hypothetical protein